MEIKKNDNSDLERKRPLFFGVGMIISLSLTITAFEWKTQIDPIMELDSPIKEFEEFLPPITINTPPPPPPKAIIIQVVEDKKIVEDPPIIDVTPSEDEPLVIIIPQMPDDIADDTPVNFAEVMPRYEGGMNEFYKLIGEKIKYPKSAKRIGVEGRVFVQFIVERDGTLKNLEVIKGIGAGCDEEALRVMNMITHFIPGKQGDVRVPVKMVIPINFVLQ